jgi:hypothetical protein
VRLGLLAVVLAACGGSLPPSAVPRPLGEDLIALLPSGAEVVIDVDLMQLRTWDEIERVLGLLPPAGRARLERLGPKWMNELDGLALGMWRSESRTQNITILRGDLDDAHLPALLDGDAQRGDLDGHTVFQAGDEVALRIGKRLVAVGSAVDARRVLEIVRGDAQGLRDARTDRALRAALAKAPSARNGRPAVLGAAIAGPLVAERFEAAGLGPHGPQACSFALAVGDGIDAVLVLGFGAPSEAQDARNDLDRALRDLRARPIIRILGLQDAFDLVFVVRDRDLRIAYRVSGTRLGAFLDRLDRAKKAFDALHPPTPPTAQPPPPEKKP